VFICGLNINFWSKYKVDITGKWNLEVDSMFGKVPFSLEISQKADGGLHGYANTQYGGSAMDNVSLTGNELNADAKLAIQGQNIEVKIRGTINGNAINGKVSTSYFGIPAMNFTGNREV
jgi:hypothetical protein